MQGLNFPLSVCCLPRGSINCRNDVDLLSIPRNLMERLPHDTQKRDVITICTHNTRDRAGARHPTTWLQQQHRSQNVCTIPLFLHCLQAEPMLDFAMGTKCKGFKFIFVCYIRLNERTNERTNGQDHSYESPRLSVAWD